MALTGEASQLVRGPEAARATAAMAAATFAGAGVGQALPVPERADSSIPIVDALISLGYAASRGEENGSSQAVAHGSKALR